jgi:transposase
MPPQRTPLRNINGNQQKRGIELTPYQRGLVVGQSLAGKSVREIEVDLELSRGAVRRTLDSTQLRDEGHSLPRSGQKLKYDSRSCRRMLLCLRNHPKMTYAQRREHVGVKMSNSYIYNLAKSKGMVHWRAKKRPELTEAHAASRLLWCKCRRHWKTERWREYMWSDECSVERGKGGEIVWVWGHHIDKWKPTHVETYKAGKQMSIMVSAAFWGNAERSDLLILERDFESKKHGYSANSYIAILEQLVIPNYTEGLIFMQDNASIHTAQKVTEWFANHGIRVTDWPPYSPDLNPIEHAWKRLKDTTSKMFPELWASDCESEEARTAMEQALKEAWATIPALFFEQLVESMERRVQACIDAEGWHTKY